MHCIFQNKCEMLRKFGGNNYIETINFNHTQLEEVTKNFKFKQLKTF